MYDPDDYAYDLAEADWAERWTTAWDRLEAIGVVGPEDVNMPLSELERIAAQLGRNVEDVPLREDLL